MSFFCISERLLMYVCEFRDSLCISYYVFGISASLCIDVRFKCLSLQSYIWFYYRSHFMFHILLVQYLNINDRKIRIIFFQKLRHKYIFWNMNIEQLCRSGINNLYCIVFTFAWTKTFYFLLTNINKQFSSFFQT